MDDQESHERNAAQGGALVGLRHVLAVERGDGQAVLTELATVEVEVRAAITLNHCLAAAPLRGGFGDG